ncbi:hypothetical protein [Nocardia thailandica]
MSADEARAAWIAARLAEAPPLSGAQQHTIRRAFAGIEIQPRAPKAAA